MEKVTLVDQIEADRVLGALDPLGWERPVEDLFRAVLGMLA